MAITLYHHPYSRAVSVVAMLECVGVDYNLERVDMLKGEHKSEKLLALNPMGKLPILVDGDVVLTEAAAIGLYLADRYAAGTMAPALDDNRRGAYLRWSLYAPSVVEPAAMAHMEKWKVNPQSAGWGTIESVHATLEHAVANGPWILGDMFSMADVILGGTIRYMLSRKTLEARPSLVAYCERYGAHPSIQKSDAMQAEFLKEFA